MSNFSDMRKYASIITRLVSIPEAVRMYFPQYVSKRNRIPCPIHNGTDCNLSYTNEVYHCFVCNDGGNVIHFVQHAFGISFSDAVKKINSDFKLNLPIGQKVTLKERRAIEQRRKEIENKTKTEQNKKDIYNKMYDAVWTQWFIYERWKREYAPSNINDEVDKRYEIACKYFDYIDYQADMVDFLKVITSE